MKNMLGKTGESFSSCYYPYVHLVRFPCTRPMCISCVSCACGLCTSKGYSPSSKGSRTPKIFCPINRTTILALQSVDFGREKTMALTLTLWRWKTTLTKSHYETLTYKEVFIRLPIGLKGLKSL